MPWSWNARRPCRMHRRHFFTSKASNCMPTRCSDLIANLVASWVLHTERIMGGTVPTGFPSAFDSVLSAGVCVGAEITGGTQAKQNTLWSQCQIGPEKNSRNTRTTWFQWESESDFCANIAQICHLHAAFFWKGKYLFFEKVTLHVLSSGLNSNHQTTNGFWQNCV